MTIGSDYTRFQNFANDEAKKLGITPDELKSYLGSNTQNVMDFLNAQASALKDILNNPHLNKDGFEAEYIRIKDEIKKFMDPILDNVRDKLSNKGMKTEDIDTFINDFVKEVNDATGADGLLNQLKSRGQSSVFSLSAEPNIVVFPPSPDYQWPPPPPGPLLPITLPTVKTPFTVTSLITYFQDLLSPQSTVQLSDGAKNLIKDMLNILQEAGPNSKLSDLWPKFQNLAKTDASGRNVFAHYLGLDTDEYNFINQCISGTTTGPGPLPAGVVASDMETRIHDLQILSHRPNGQSYADFIYYLTSDEHFTYNSPLSFLQKKASTFSFTDSYQNFSVDQKNQFASTTGISPQPLVNMIQSYKDFYYPKMWHFFDMLLEDAKKENLDKPFNYPKDLTDFVNKSINSLHQGVDVYIYTNPSTTQQQSRFSDAEIATIKDLIPGLNFPPKLPIDETIEKFEHPTTPPTYGNTYYLLLGALRDVVNDNSIPQADKLDAFQKKIGDFYFSNNAQFAAAPYDVQVQFLQMAGTTFQAIFTERFAPFLKEHPNMTQFVESFLNIINTQQAGPNDFHNELANYITSLDNTKKLDIYMMFPNITPEDIQTLSNEVLPGWNLPAPAMTPTDKICQMVWRQTQNETLPSDDQNVLGKILNQIHTIGSYGGGAIDIQNWVRNYLDSGMDGLHPQPQTIQWIRDNILTNT